MESFQLDKTLWTEADFEKMGWHDSIIYGLSLVSDRELGESELMLDIDYIFRWNNPEPPATHYTFWVSPCTLVFKNVLNVQIELDSSSLIGPEMEISDINLLGPVDRNAGFAKANKWQIELQNGDIFLEADGFVQYVRKLPAYQQEQQILLDIRGGISFEKKPAGR